MMNRSARPATAWRRNSKRYLNAFALIGALSVLTPAHADRFDDLLHKLKEKGILTEEEFKILSEGRKSEPQAPAAAPAKQTAQKPSEAPKSNELKGTFNNGVVFESADKTTRFQPYGNLHFDYRMYRGEDVLNADGFDARRATLGAKGKFFGDYEYDLRGEYSALSNNAHLDIAWVNIGWWKSAQIRFGQFKTPFSMQQLTTANYLDFLERSMGDALAPGKERGVMLHGKPGKGWFYGLALSTGQGRNSNETSNVMDKTDVIGRLGYSFAELFDAKNAVYHVAGAYTRGKLPPAAAPEGRTEARGIRFFQPAAFDAPEFDRVRHGAEAALALGPLKLQGEYVNANFDGRSAAGVDFDRDIKTYYAAAFWMLTGESYADIYRGGDFGRIVPRNNFKPGGGKGAFELGLRYSVFDASDFTATNPVGTGVIPASNSNEAKAWTLGLKWIANPNTRFLLNYVQTKFETPVTVTQNGTSASTEDEKAFTLRGQFDF